MAFSFLAGDADGNRIVNFNDLLTLARNYNKTGMTLAQGDFDGNGTVNFNDLLILARNYNKSLPAGAAEVPAQAVPLDPQEFTNAFGARLVHAEHAAQPRPRRRRQRRRQRQP